MEASETAPFRVNPKISVEITRTKSGKRATIRSFRIKRGLRWFGINFRRGFFGKGEEFVYFVDYEKLQTEAKRRKFGKSVMEQKLIYDINYSEPLDVRVEI